MLDRRRPPEHIALELAALRIEHDHQSNLILRLADALYLSPEERDVLGLLASERQEVAAFAAGLLATLDEPQADPQVDIEGLAVPRGEAPVTAGDLASP